MAMEQDSALITIPFKPLLHQICSFLGFPPPIFGSSPASVQNCYVLVCCPNKPPSFVYFRGDEGTYDESAERACKRMVLFLVKEYTLRVDDVNLPLLDENEGAAAEFKLKKKQLECVEKGVSCSPLDGEAEASSHVQISPSITIDFYSLLGTVVSKFQILFTHVEYIHYGKDAYKSWLSIARPNSIPKTMWIRSDICTSMAAARQCLAKKVLIYLMPIYSFAVENVSYHFLQFSAFASSLERESYLTIKERVYGVKEDSSACPILQQELT